MTSVEFEPTISAGERPQTYALDGAATGTGLANITVAKPDIWHDPEPLSLTSRPHNLIEKDTS